MQLYERYLETLCTDVDVHFVGTLVTHGVSVVETTEYKRQPLLQVGVL